MLNPVLPAPRSRRIQTARNVVDVILNARSAADLRLYAWEKGQATADGRFRWKGTEEHKGQYRTQKTEPGTGRGKKPQDATAAPAEGEQPQAKQPAQKKQAAPRKPKVDHNEVGDKIEKMMGSDFADQDVGALREELLSLTGAQLDEVKKRFAVRGGKGKADVAGRIAGHVGGSRKKAGQPAEEAAPTAADKPGLHKVEGSGPFREGGFMAPGIDKVFGTSREANNAARSEASRLKKQEKTRKGDLARLNMSREQAGLPPRTIHPMDAKEMAAKSTREGKPIPEEVLAEYPDLAPAPEKPARKPRAVKQPVRQPEPTPEPPRKPPIAIGPEDVAGIIGEENPAPKRKSVGEVVDDRDTRVQAHAERVARELERRKKPTPNPREQRNRSGLGQAPQVQPKPKPQPRTAPSSLTRNRLTAGVKSSALPAGKPQAKRTGRGILNARNPVDVVLFARSPQQARPLLYAWLRTASKRNPSKTVWVNSANPKDRRYQESMPKQRATQAVESLPPQEHLQQILEAPYKVADYYLTSLQTRLRKMRPGALEALRMTFDKEG